MNNMKPEIVYSRWTIVDSMHGVTLYPHDVSILDAIEDSGGSDVIYSVEVEFAWAYRLSMPGYLDCTDWIGPFDWKVDAQRDCDDMLRMEA
jgi:hypothetical protein